MRRLRKAGAGAGGSLAPVGCQTPPRVDWMAGASDSLMINAVTADCSSGRMAGRYVGRSGRLPLARRA